MRKEVILLVGILLIIGMGVVIAQDVDTAVEGSDDDTNVDDTSSGVKIKSNEVLSKEIKI